MNYPCWTSSGRSMALLDYLLEIEAYAQSLRWLLGPNLHRGDQRCWDKRLKMSGYNLCSDTVNEYRSLSLYT